MSTSNNQAINDKLKNLISISARDYCINSKSKSKHFLITDKFLINDLIEFIEGRNEVLKFDEEYGLNKLYQLNRSAITFFKESGTWPLFIARYFLNTKTDKGKSVFAPLILRRIKIEKNIDNYCAYLIDDEYVINEKLLTFIEREYNVNLSSLYSNNQQLSIIDYIDKLQVVLNKKIEIISENENIELFDDDAFYVTDSFVIGLYEPGGGKLKDDLLSIINQGIDPFNAPKINGETFYKEQEIGDEPIFQISNNLNLYQKYAIRSSLVENTVIHGPPGTGKSEVIANIIANIIINNKNALVISEKKAALDVIVERINALKILSLSLYDDMKNDFYQAIIDLSIKLGTDWLSQSFNASSFQLSDYVKLFDEYKKLKKFRTNIKTYANRFIDLSKTNIELENKLYDFWKTINQFSLKKYLLWKESSTINKLCEKINNQDYFNELEKTIDIFKKYGLNNKDLFHDFKNFYDLIINEFIETASNNKNEFIDELINHTNELNTLLNSIKEKKEIIELLYKNNNYIFDQYLTYKKIIKEYEKLITPNYFEVLKNNDFKNFLIQYFKVTPLNKKYFIYEYVNNHKIVDKIPLFKKSTGIDKYVVDFFDKLYESGFCFLDQNIIDHISLFHPIVVKSYFNNKLFDKGIIEAFVNNINFRYEFYELEFIVANDVDYNILKNFYHILELQKTLNINNLEINAPAFDLLLHDNSDYSLDTNKILELYINNLKSVLSNLPDELKNKVKELLRICHLKKRPTIYMILENYSDVLKILFPIWITKPEPASLFLPLKQNLFEYGIFDEASQMFLEKSFALVYRVNKAIVAGDDKQLKPTSFFMSINSDEEIEYDITDTNVAESLLEKAQSSLWNTFILKNHYRSQSKDLIEFSNKYIYNNELIYATINDNNQNKYGLETINVDGCFNNGINKVEAQKVIEVLNQNLDLYKKIVIITFNASQSKYIEQQILKLSNPKILQKIEQGLLVITNLENVQGNEGDLVIISVSYGKKDENSKMHSNFGPLINDGGSNRLNVAITRAKDKMVVVKSFYASDVSITNNDNLLTFRNFIAFLDAKQNETSDVVSLPIKNYFTNLLINLSQQYNLNLKYNINVGSDQITYLLLKNDQIIFSINFRNYNYYNNLIDLNIDIDKTFFLNARKYNVHLINEWEWILTNELVIDYIKKLFMKYCDIGE